MSWQRPNQPAFVGNFNEIATDVDHTSAVMIDERYDTLRTHHNYKDALGLAVQGTHEYLERLSVREALEDETGNLSALLLPRRFEQLEPYTEFEARRWSTFVNDYLSEQFSAIQEDDAALAAGVQNAYERQDTIDQGIAAGDRITIELCAAIERQRILLSVGGEDLREPISFGNRFANRALVNTMRTLLPLGAESEATQKRTTKLRKTSHTIKRTASNNSYQLLKRVGTPEGFRTEITTFTDHPDGIVRVQTGKGQRWDMLDAIGALNLINPKADIDLSRKPEPEV